MVKTGTTRAEVLLVLFSLLLAFLVAVLTSLQASFYPEEAEAKGVTPSEYGLVFGMFGFIVAVLSPVTGYLIPLLGTRAVFYVGLLITGFSVFLFGLMTWLRSHWSFLSASILLRVTEAIGATFVNISLFSLLMFNFPNSIASSVGIVDSCYGVGFAIGPVVGAVLYHLGGFLLPFVAVGATFLALAPIAFLFVLPGIRTAPWGQDTPPLPQGGPSTGAFLHGMFTTPAMLLLLLTELVTSSGWGFVVATLEPFVRQEFEVTTLEKALFYSIYGTTFAILVFPLGVVADRYVPPIYLVVTGTVCQVLSFVLIGPIPAVPLQPHMYLTLLSLFLVGLGFALISAPAHSQFVRDIQVHDLPFNDGTVGMANGVWFATMSLGSFLGPLVGGILLDHFGFRGATYLPLALLLFVAVLQWRYMCSRGGQRNIAIAWSTISDGREEINESSGETLPLKAHE